MKPRVPCKVAVPQHGGRRRMLATRDNNVQNRKYYGARSIFTSLGSPTLGSCLPGSVTQQNQLPHAYHWTVEGLRDHN